jgi:hypothetical protein
MIDGRPSYHFCYGFLVDHTHTHTIRENPLLPFLFDLLNRVRSSLDVHWPVAPVAANSTVWLVCLLPSELERRIFFVRYLPIFGCHGMGEHHQRAGPDLDVERSSQAEGRRKLTIQLV